MALLTLAFLGCTDKSPVDTATSDDSDQPVEESSDTAPVDADGDGYTADEDCDDNDDKVFPGAHEVWYDGEDWDCAGDDDYDADADGHRHENYDGDDCDDQEPTVHPGADEVACDDIDQDCDGQDSTDADGDGELPPDCGGADCDDTNPWIGAEQEEWCDERDHDCDGEPLSQGVCAKAQEALAVSAMSMMGDASELDVFDPIGTVGDLDGDGADDVLVYCSSCSFGEDDVAPAWHVLGGSEWTWNELHTSWQLGAFSAVGWEDGFWRTAPTGDFDGDGVSDLMAVSGVSGHGSASGDGVAYLLSGPADAWPGGSTAEDLAAHRWISWKGETPLGHVQVSGDFDSDGLADVAVGGIGGSLQADDRVYLLFGRAGGDVNSDLGEEIALLDRDADAGEIGLGWEMTVGDLDGDGVSDLVIVDTHADRVYLVSGGQLKTADHGRIDDVAWQTWTGQSECVAVIDDWDGDGIDDWVSGSRYHSVGGEPVGAYRFIAGATEYAATKLQDHLDLVHGAAKDRSIGGFGSAMDVDGDGKAELVAAGDSTLIDGRYAYGLIRSEGGLPQGSNPYVPDLEYVLDDERLLESVGDLPHGDWDGDGAADLFFLQYGATTGPGGFTSVAGWDIPWDVPEYW